MNIIFSNMNLVFFFLSVLFKESMNLKFLGVSVPPYLVRGATAELRCDYDLEGEALYAVKWYRGGEEFYRFIPRHDPPAHAYRLDGIRVDVSRSDSVRVTLWPVTLKTSGVFRCEVSAEAPSFASAAGEGTMHVLYLPREGPKISISEVEDRRGNSLVLNCTSGRAYPAPELNWDVDGKRVSDPELLIPFPVAVQSHGLQTSTLALRLQAPRSVSVRCKQRLRAPSDMERQDDSVMEIFAETKEAMLMVRASGSAVKSCLMLLTLATSVSTRWRLET